MKRNRLTTIGAAAIVLVLLGGAAVVGLRWWSEAHRTDLQQAMAVAPHDAQRLSWTDWAGVRDELGVALDDDSPQGEVATFLDNAYSADLSSTSALPESAQVMHVQLGFSPASVDWELFSQSDEGAVILLHLPESTDWGAIAERLKRVGYTEPAESDGIWEGGNDVLGRLGGVTPEIGYLALSEDESLILASDTGDYLESALDDATDGDTGDAAAGLEEVVDASDSPLAAALYTGDFACGALSMGQADTGEQAVADRLLAEAGEVNPFTGFAMSVQPGGRLRVALSFESDDQARTNADSRAVLAAGPAPGQGGDFADRFTLGTVEADGAVVTMALEPVEGAYVLSDLSTGPLLFATC